MTTAAAIARPLRDYQGRCIDLTYQSILDSWKHAMPLAGYYTLPTGTGKTRIATGLIEKLSRHGRVLVVAHRKELIEQMAASIREDIPGSDVGIWMAERKEFYADIVVGSIQTLSRGLEGFVFAEWQGSVWYGDLKPIVALLIDEAHHVQEGNSYAQLIEQVRAASPQCAVIGCTATSFRSDKKPMQAVLPTCLFSRTIPDMQEAGWLSPVTWNPLRLNFDTSAFRTSSLDGEKDFKAEDIESALFPQSMDIVEKTIPLIGDRPFVVFAATVRHAQDLADSYQAGGLHVAAIWGDMQKYNRESILKAWKSGFLQGVVNVGILTEGFDYTPMAPNQEGLAAMVIARPTMSPSLYLQMLGRGTRLKPGQYKDCLVIDCVGNANLLETKQITLPKVMPTHKEEEESSAESFAQTGRMRLVPKRKPFVLKINGPFERSWAAWGYDDKTGIYYSQIQESVYAVLVPDASGSGLHHGYILSKNKTPDGVRWIKESITSRPCLLAENMQHLNHVYASNGKRVLVDKDAKWRRGHPTDKALSLLRSLDRPGYALALADSWNAGEVSLALTWAILQRPLQYLLKGIHL